MKRITFSILSLTAVLVLITSCSSNDPAGTYADWKIKNDTYFTNYKDSTGYVLYTIPASSGGGSFYYKVSVAGDPGSVSPTVDEQVLVNYRGKMISGVVFDQTYQGKILQGDTTAVPRLFYPKQLIRGWMENLKQMKTGEVRTIVLPQELGYGSVGVSHMISPYSTTIWVVQLVSFNHVN